MKERILYIDIIKVVAIVMVVVGHMRFEQDVMSKVIALLEMPLFFFASGYLTTYNCSQSIMSSIIKIAKRLLVPYVSYITLCILLKGSSISIICSHFKAGGWFLPVLFSLHLFGCLLKYSLRLKFNRYLQILIFAIVYLFLWIVYHNNTFGEFSDFFNIMFLYMYFPFFALGNIVKHNIKILVPQYEYLAFFICAAIFIMGVCSSELKNINCSWFVCAFSGVLLSFLISYRLSNIINDAFKKVLVWISNRTIDIYLIHFFIFQYLLDLHYLIGVLLTIAISLLFGYIIRKSRVLSIILLGVK